MSLETITNAEINASKMEGISSRPNAPKAMGGGGMSAQDLKKKMDALPMLAIEKINELIEKLNASPNAVAECIADIIKTGIAKTEGQEYTLSELFEAITSGDLSKLITVPTVRNGAEEQMPLDALIEDTAQEIWDRIFLIILDLSNKAQIDSPTFIGEPKAPSPMESDDSTRIATTNWVKHLLENYFDKTTGTIKIHQVVGLIAELWEIQGYIANLSSTTLKVNQKGTPNGVAELDENGIVPVSQLPSFVDDVLEFNGLSAFPVTGESGKIYVDLNSNKSYRWSGTTYVEISKSVVLGETGETAYRGDRGKTAYEHSISKHLVSISNTTPQGATGYAQLTLAFSDDSTSSIIIPISEGESGVVVSLENGSGDYSVEQKYAEGAVDYSAQAEGKNSVAFGGKRYDKLDVSGVCQDTSVRSDIAEANISLDATVASGNQSFASGGSVQADGKFSHAEGYYTHAEGQGAHTEGGYTWAKGKQSHAEGASTFSKGNYSHSEGEQTTATGQSSHAEGRKTIADGNGSHAEGNENRAGGLYSHAEGTGNYAGGTASHAEGNYTNAEANFSHTEGDSSVAKGTASHAEGYYCLTTGGAAHAEGWRTKAHGNGSHSEGFYTVANQDYQHVFGKLNDYKAYTINLVEMVGGGYRENNTDIRRNIRTLSWDGDETLAGTLTVGKAPVNDNDVVRKIDLDTMVSLVSNVPKAKSYANIQELVAGLNDSSNTSFIIGNNIFDERLGTPDYWITSVEETSAEYTYTTDEQFITDVENGTAQLGYYKLKVLGTEKVDLSDYARKTDYATESEGGVVKIANIGGLQIVNGLVSIVPATTGDIDASTDASKPITSLRVDYAVMKALTDPINHTWTDAQKASARDTLGLSTVFSTFNDESIISPPINANHEYRSNGQIDGFTLEFPANPNNDFVCSIEFESGIEPTLITYANTPNVYSTGDDCTDGNFVPVGNMHYTWLFWYSGGKYQGVVRRSQ